MNNPESHSIQLSPRTMYKYDQHTNLPWNIKQYEVPTLHYDYKNIMRDRMYASQKKGVKVNDFYVTRRGFYMDYDLKIAKGIPSSVVHIDQKPWDGTKIALQAEQLKMMRQSKKFTYLQKLQIQQQKRPVPGISTYKLQKSPEQQKQLTLKYSSREISQGQKRYFYENTQNLSESIPGPGSYNPHDQVANLNKSKGDWKYWCKKHEKLEKILTKRQSKMPAPGTYTPVYRSYSSFEALEKKNKKQKQIKNGFGSDSRFPYMRPNKKQIIEKRPSPVHYQTKIDWKGKSISPKKKQWIKMIWKGSPPKVYS